MYAMNVSADLPSLQSVSLRYWSITLIVLDGRAGYACTITFDDFVMRSSRNLYN
jgi:hypothetical protein